MNEIERAYRDGEIDAKLKQYDAHFKVINGSIERTATHLAGMERQMDKMNDQLVGLLVVLPKIQDTANKVEQAEEVAETLRQKDLADSSLWDRKRSVLAWVIGLGAGGVVIADFLARTF